MIHFLEFPKYFIHLLLLLIKFRNHCSQIFKRFKPMCPKKDRQLPSSHIWKISEAVSEAAE